MATLQNVINSQLVLSQAQLKADKPLLQEIQTQLNRLGLYPGGQLLDGLWGDKTAVQFVDRHLKPNIQSSKLRSLALALRVQRNISSTSDSAFEVDVRIATEVTEILRQVVAVSRA